MRPEFENAPKPRGAPSPIGEVEARFGGDCSAPPVPLATDDGGEEEEGSAPWIFKAAPKPAAKGGQLVLPSVAVNSEEMYL